MISRQENIRSPLAVHDPQRERGSRRLIRPGRSPSARRVRARPPATQARRASSRSQAATRGAEPRRPARARCSTPRGDARRGPVAAHGSSASRRRTAAPCRRAPPRAAGPRRHVPPQPALVVAQERPRLGDRHPGRQGQRRAARPPAPPAAPSAAPARCAAAGPRWRDRRCGWRRPRARRQTGAPLRQDEVAHLRLDQAAPARAVEDAVVPDALRRRGAAGAPPAGCGTMSCAASVWPRPVMSSFSPSIVISPMSSIAAVSTSVSR